VGKVAIGQVPYLMALPLIAGAVPAARFGSIVGKRAKTQFLRWLLALIIIATAVKLWFSIIQ
jgi:uncharacterized membrane protein YfcA